jgi:hypothetical protein
VSEPLAWRKSRRSNSANSNCVEVASLPDGAFAVRDSKDKGGPVLWMSADRWRQFTAEIKADHE